MRQRQIRLSPQGLWHRPFDGNGGDHTACGEPIGVAIAIRDHVLDLDLCPLCWTKKERDTGRIRRLIRDHEDEDAELYFDEDYERTEPDIDVIPNDHDRKDKNRGG